MSERLEITDPSRIMLPAYIVLCVSMGLSYCFDASVQTARAVQFQKDILELPVWGGVQLFLGVAMTVTWLVRPHRFVLAYVVALCAVTWLIWAVTYSVTVFTNDATLIGTVLALFVSAACVATIVSLVNKDVSRYVHRKG